MNRQQNNGTFITDSAKLFIVYSFLFTKYKRWPFHIFSRIHSSPQYEVKCCDKIQFGPPENILVTSILSHNRVDRISSTTVEFVH